MTAKRGGLLFGIGLAAGLAIGTAHSVVAADSSPSATPAATFRMGPGMMSGSSPMSGMMGAQTGTAAVPSGVWQACDAMHDAMRSWLDANPSAQPDPDDSTR